MKNITQCSKQAADWIKQGRVLAYPTESVWGLGCHPYQVQAIERILHLKDRPKSKGMLVVTGAAKHIQSWLDALPADRRQAVLESWQQANIQKQAFTWRMATPLHTNLPKQLVGAQSGVAVRVIGNALIESLCEHLKDDTNPHALLVSTSCNPANQAPACTLEQALGYFGDRVCYLSGPTMGYTKPSQIKDALSGQVLRS